MFWSKCNNTCAIVFIKYLFCTYIVLETIDVFNIIIIIINLVIHYNSLLHCRLKRVNACPSLEKTTIIIYTIWRDIAWYINNISFFFTDFNVWIQLVSSYISTWLIKSITKWKRFSFSSSKLNKFSWRSNIPYSDSFFLFLNLLLAFYITSKQKYNEQTDIIT